MKLDLYANRTGSKDEILVCIHKSNSLYPINYIPILHTKNSKYYVVFSSPFSWTNSDEDDAIVAEAEQTGDSSIGPIYEGGRPCTDRNLRPIKCYDPSEGVRAVKEWSKNCNDNTAYPHIVFTVHSLELFNLPLVMNRLIKVPIPPQITNVSGFNIIMTDSSQILISIIV